MEHIVFDKNLTRPDHLVLQSLSADLKDRSSRKDTLSNGSPSPNAHVAQTRDGATIAALTAWNDPSDSRFEPTVFSGIDQIRLPRVLDEWVLRPCIQIARSIVRVETDVVMLTHLLLYFMTSIPSAIYLFWSFSWIHGVLHFVMQFSYMGTYTLMMHQHIHMRGILNKCFFLFDSIFPYITDPLMGHTWNTYYYHQKLGPNTPLSTTKNPIPIIGPALP